MNLTSRGYVVKAAGTKIHLNQNAFLASANQYGWIYFIINPGRNHSPCITKSLQIPKVVEIGSENQPACDWQTNPTRFHLHQIGSTHTYVCSACSWNIHSRLCGGGSKLVAMIWKWTPRFSLGVNKRIDCVSDEWVSGHRLFRLGWDVAGWKLKAHRDPAGRCLPRLKEAKYFDARVEGCFQLV